MNKISTALAISALFILAGCGGGTETPITTAQLTPRLKALAASSAALPAALPSVISLNKVSETRITRTVYEYSFTVTAKNDGPLNRGALTLLASSTSGYTSIVMGSASFDGLAAGATGNSTNQIVVRHDRIVPFDANKIKWTDSSQRVVGRVMDGYIQAAIVYWDCNGNKTLDSTEVSVRSGPSGLYSIDRPTGVFCSLLAQVGSGAIDETYPNLSIGAIYQLAAAPNSNELITPYTTMVYGMLSSNPTLSVAIADDRLQKAIGFRCGSVLVDYIGSTSINNAACDNAIKTAAQFYRSLLQDQPSSLPFDTAVSRALERLTLLSSAAGFTSSLALGLMPYVYSPSDYSSLITAISPSTVSNSATKLFLADPGPNHQAEITLRALSTVVNTEGKTSFDYIDLNPLSDTRLQEQMFALLHMAESNPELGNQSEILNARKMRNTLLADLRDRLKLQVDDEGNWQNVFTNDPIATRNFVASVASSVLSASFDALSLSTYKPGLSFLRPNKYTTALNVKKALDKYKDTFDKLDKGLSIYKAYILWVGYCNKAQPTDADLDEAISATFQAILDLSTGYGHKTDFGAALGTLFNGALADKAVQIRWTIDIVDCSKEIAAIVLDKDPVGSRIVSLLDLIVQGYKSWFAGEDLANKAANVMDANVARAINDFDLQAGKAFRDYYIAFILAFQKNYVITNTGSDAYVLARQSTTQADGSILIELSGGNFTASYPNATLGGLLCRAFGTQTSVAMQYVCPTGTLVDSAKFDLKNGTQASLPGAAFWVTIETAPAPVTVTVSANAALGVPFTNPHPVKAVTCAITASGTWNNGPTATYGPDGAPGICGPGCKFPNAPSLALTMQRKDGSYIVIGSSKTISLSANEMVVFANNDSLNFYFDNHGSVQATATCTPTVLPPMDGSISVDAIVLNGSVMTVPLGVSSCSFAASGTWSVIPGTSSGADGLLGQTFYQTKILNSPVGALVMRRPPQSTYTYVGASKTLAVNSGEQLEFSTDDGLNPVSYTNNFGTLAVQYHCN